nr:ABC transporter ATP-binding protein [Leucobacter weissii]
MRVRYGPQLVLDGVDLRLERGESLAVVGESGSGKSTLLRALARLQRADEGEIHWFGEPVAAARPSRLRRLRARLQMVFQDSSSTLDPRFTVRQAVREGLDVHGEGLPSERARRVADLLARLGIADELHDRLPHELSGGQRQRVNIARALVLRPEVVFFDEPVSSLDVIVQRDLIELLDETRTEQGLTSIVVLHDLAVAAQLASRIVVLRSGVVVEEGPAHELLTAPRHPYTRELLLAARAAAR